MNEDLDFRFPTIDRRAALATIIYFAGMIVWGVDFWKAVVFAVIVFFCLKYSFGRAALLRGAVAILFFGLAVWSGALASPDQWPRIIKSTLADLNGKLPTETTGPQANKN